jgi:hypothetical protein
MQRCVRINQIKSSVQSSICHTCTMLLSRLSLPVVLTLTKLVVVCVTQAEDGERAVLKSIFGRRLPLDESYESTSILGRIAVAGGGSDDHDAIFAVRSIGRRRLLPRRLALLLELIELGTKDGIEARGGLEFAGDVLGNVFGVARGAAVKDKERCHRRECNCAKVKRSRSRVRQQQQQQQQRTRQAGWL